MIEFRDALTDLLEEFGTDDGGFKGDLPEGRYMRVDSKNFYFDIGQNNRGIYMRISEVYIYYLRNKWIDRYKLSLFSCIFSFHSKSLFYQEKHLFQIDGYFKWNYLNVIY